MSIYNSQHGSVHDDSDITIINPSITHEDDDEYIDETYVPIIERLKQANHSSENRQITNSQLITTTSPIESRDTFSNIPGGHEFIIVGRDISKNAEEIEEVLNRYILDLKKDSNTQLYCDKELVIRLMNLIRPAYSGDQQKATKLNQMVEEIGVQHDKRHIEQQEKLEQLRTETHRLNQMLFSTNNIESLPVNTTRNNNNNSMYSILQRGCSSIDDEQWTEIEGDAKRLHELVELQRNQINEIISLISQTAKEEAVIKPPPVDIKKPDNTTIKQQPPLTPTKNMINDLLEKIHLITRTTTEQQGPTITAHTPNTLLINHSPGTSPTQSLNTLTLSTLTPTIVDPPEEIIEKPPTPVMDKPHPVIPIPIIPPPTVPAPAPPIETKKCPVCNFEFSSTSDDVDMYDHIERCLFPAGNNPPPQDYECPNCQRKYPGKDETDYLQHLSDCYNRND